MNTRNRTSSEYIDYGLYFYFSGLSLRKTSERLSSCFIKRNHVSVWNWIQKYKPKKIFERKKKIEEFIIDETLIKIGSELIWLWVAIGLESKELLGIRIFKERNMLLAEQFIQA
jgi:putative transposase